MQYIPRNMHTVFALLCFVVVIHWLIFPYPSGLLHWHCGNLTIAPVPAKQPWWIWINTSCEFIMNDCITTTKQSTTKPCAYFLGYTVCEWDSRRNTLHSRELCTWSAFCRLSCFIVVFIAYKELFEKCPVWLNHWHWPVHVKQPWRIWVKHNVNTLSIDDIARRTQSSINYIAYAMGYYYILECNADTTLSIHWSLCWSDRDRKCLDLRGARTPNLRIHAECSNHLSYQGQTCCPMYLNTGSDVIDIF